MIDNFDIWKIEKEQLDQNNSALHEIILMLCVWLYIY